MNLFYCKVKADPEVTVRFTVNIDLSVKVAVSLELFDKPVSRNRLQLLRH
jgi:hypothetical protein